MREQTILKRTLLLCSRGSRRLFRNNVGSLRDAVGRWVTYGIGNPGGSDLIGWNSVVITEEMVGLKVAIFTAIEIKTKNAKPTSAQLDFLAMVTGAGGRGGIAHSPEEALEIMAGVDKNNNSE